MPPTNNPRTAIVTGGASGIGAAIARRLASDGLRVATLDITPAEGDSSYVVDVTDRAQIDAALADIHAKFGPVSILVTLQAQKVSPDSSISPSMNGSDASMSRSRESATLSKSSSKRPA
jgi:NAD(P)-dependent dehydrogenase (short-subunit alcohol dehydrogenase family)